MPCMMQIWGGVKYFIFDYKLAGWWREDSFSTLSDEIKLIPWAHTFPFIWDLDVMAHHSKVARIIAVGREERDLYLDHPSFEKVDYIYNAVPIDNKYIELTRKHPNHKRKHIVTFMGSLTPHKCFHKLAEIWPSVLRDVPDAELYVIGAGNLYDNKTSLGKYGIAEQQYEDRFIKYLIDVNGHILPSVHFMGKLGNEKFDILLNTKVGVPNPTGKSETFCICAVEMQAMGCKVAAMKAPGYYDTFLNGCMVNNPRGLKNMIVKFLREEVQDSYDATINAIKVRYSIETVIEQWEKLLQDILRAESLLYLHDRKFNNLGYRMKWLKFIHRMIIRSFPSLFYKPVEFYIQKLNRNPDYSIN